MTSRRASIFNSAHSENTAPKMPVGTVSSTAKGTLQLSYKAARQRNTKTRAKPNTWKVELADFFSSRLCPDHSILKPVPASSKAICSMASIACPELTPGAALPWMVTARVALKREITVGPVLRAGLSKVSRGTILSVELFTNMNFIASDSLRKEVSDWSTTL